jgi:hypothetical protein
MSPVRALALVLVALVTVLVPAAATGGSSGNDPKKLVLQGRDLPAGVQRVKARSVPNAVANREAPGNDNFTALSRLSGYEVQYARKAAPTLELITAANLFKSSLGAEEALGPVIRWAQAGGPAFSRVSLRDSLGHESRLYKGRTTRAGKKLDVYLVVWRSVRTIAVLRATAAAGTLPRDDVLALARDQQDRVSRYG